jgi:hypothetical protein
MKKQKAKDELTARQIAGGRAKALAVLAKAFRERFPAQAKLDDEALIERFGLKRQLATMASFYARLGAARDLRPRRSRSAT